MLGIKKERTGRIKYINNPPRVVAEIPPYLFKRYAKTIVTRLIAWANKEFYDTLVELYATEQLEIAQYYEKNYTYLNAIAESRTFKTIVPMISADVWADMDRNMQDILISAHKLIAKG